jgi:hypothetical protein
LAAALEQEIASAKTGIAKLEVADGPRVYYAGALDGSATHCDSVCGLCDNGRF